MVMRFSIRASKPERSPNVRAAVKDRTDRTFRDPRDAQPSSSVGGTAAREALRRTVHAGIERIG